MRNAIHTDADTEGSAVNKPPLAFVAGVDEHGCLVMEHLPAGWVRTTIVNGFQLTNTFGSKRDSITVLCSHAEHGGANVVVVWTGKDGAGEVLLADITESAADTFRQVTKTINKWMRRKERK